LGPAGTTARTAPTALQPGERLPRLPQAPATAAGGPGAGRVPYGAQAPANNIAAAGRQPVAPVPHPSGTMSTGPSTGQRMANVVKGAFQGARGAHQENNTTY
ncbi:hypothetical protein FRC05_008202, partial [Tulasnella sp. 425]